jgi:hypothetical protein
MKYLFTILLFISTGTFAQDMAALDGASDRFDKALLNKDSVALKQLVSDKIAYGHSNGWIESKRELIDDLYNGIITYKKISKADNDTKVTFEGNTASIRSNVDIDAVMEGKLLSFKLKVLQVWVWKNKHWELFARQSVKM